ncbi:MAG: cytochrome c biogenesis protein CcsA [Proteobacteria bacterium]|nr:cytochrome c biogenesis protein CcsA [Pseudomonadota bacterium]
MKQGGNLMLKLSILFIAIAIHWLLAWFWVPVDQMQGEVYKIIYLHVPSAFAAFWCAGVLFVVSILSLRNSQASRYVQLGKAATEVGLIFTILTLATGSIWGKPTWGTWWTWDARLTTTLLLSLLFVGWLLLHNSMDSGPSRNRSCAILGILIGADVPIIYKSVTFWRTLHQPQTILRPGGGTSTMDPDMLIVLVSGVVLMVVVAQFLILERRKNIELDAELTELSLNGGQ